jgi:hypothetical protein
VGRLLTERKAVLIETTEDTTRSDSARRAGSIELSVIESILGKCYASEMSRQPVHQPQGSGGGTSRNPFPTHVSIVDGFRRVFDGAIT